MQFIPFIGAGLDLAKGIGQEKIAKYNARLAELQGKAAGEQALATESIQRKENAQFLGKQAAAFAESGVGYGGSALDVQAQSATDAELDALTIRYKGQLARLGFNADASMTRVQGRNEASQSYLLAGANLLKGFADYRKGA